ncbi:MAG: type II toxin-antitoxin system VapC family toxin [Acidobacteriaceae bacterium]|nr:type II toxin-antitoxin system VapC family toxin [Acidobacteriaceae bacterium]
MAEIIVDTCVWIDASQGILDLDEIYSLAGSERVHVSAISLGELEFGTHIPNDASERAARMALLRAVERMSVLAVTRETARSFGLLATMMRVAGRTPRPRSNDLWIAAQAHEHRLPLLTSNPEDFRALDAIEIIEAPRAAQ